MAEWNSETLENRKRRRERRVAILIALGFVISTLLQVFLTNRRLEYGVVQSLLYFGLLHLNVILIMFLVFLVARNLTRAYLARRTGKLGSSLRWRMVTSLLAFSLIPSALLFVGASTVIRQGFDRWFGTQVAKALDDAQAITEVHYSGIEKNLGFFGQQLAGGLRENPQPPDEGTLRNWLNRIPVEGLEFYSDLVSPPQRSLAPEVADWAVPRAAVESLQRAFAGESFQLIRQFGDSDLVQQFVPYSASGGRGILVLSQTVPLGLKTRMAELRAAFSEYQKIRLFKDSLKTNYTLVLLTLFVLVLFVVSWFGLYLAKSVTDPVSDLLRGTEAFRDGRWDYRIPAASTPRAGFAAGATADLEVLKSAFNLMASEVGQRGSKLEEANSQLISLVRELEDRERYLETLLSSIRRGVLVLDTSARIQRINAEAWAFASLEAEPKRVVGQPWRQVFTELGTDDETRIWLEEARVAAGKPVDRIFERVTGSGRESSVQSVRATGIHLLDERKVSLGWLVIIEDVSDAARLERLAAWQEVARRVAHEIKNPLTPIQISVDRLQRRMGERMQTDRVDGGVFRECVEQIQKQVRVIRDLVREFSQFAKLPEPKFRDFDLSKLLSDILEDYRFTHPEVRFHLNVRAPEERRRVRADAEYIRRLVVNLADNALHSLDESRTPNPEFGIEVSSDEPSEFLRVDFVDNGPGIPPEMREKIFDPYITSKASGQGLGLAIVRRIASEHRGRIRAEAGPGGRFVLELPAPGV